MNRSTVMAAAALVALSLALVGCAESVDGPGGDATPEALSMSPVSDEVYRCLVDKGWDVTINWAGGVGITSDEVPTGQEDQYDRDSEECWSVIDQRTAAMQPEEIEAVYEQELATRDCLIAAGYSVKAAPSKQQYVDTFHTDPWMAYGASDVVAEMSDDDAWRAINEQCRQPSWSLGH